MMKTQSKFRLRCWTYAPMLILFALSLFIYMSYMMIYIVKLLANSYEFSIFQPPGQYSQTPTVVATMQRITDYSNHAVSWVGSHSDTLTSMQKKGLVYLLVSHFAFALYIISAIRSAKTSPGHVPADWHSNTEKNVKKAIETEKRVLTNIHKTIRKKKQELLLQKAQPIIIEASISQENDFLVSPDSNSTKDFENSLLISPEELQDKHEVINIADKANSEESHSGTNLTDDEEKPEEGSKEKLLKEQIKKIELKDGLYSSEKIKKLAVLNVLRNEKKRYCGHCEKFKPERAHHCSQCGYCVLRMDHHCPWINNCIGFYNYKYFFSMIFWANVSLLFVAMTYCEAVVDSLLNIKMPWFLAYLTILSYIVIVVLSVILVFFICFHIWLACSGKTTLEFCENKLRTRYDKGVLENLRRVLGRYYFTWLLPCAPNLEGEGLVF